MAEPLTEERLAAIEARCQAATPGPWSVDGAVEWDCDGGEECRCQETSNWRDCLQPYWIRGTWLHGPEWIEDDDKSYFNEDDAAFAAAARADVPDLLAEVRRLRAAGEALTRSLEAIVTGDARLAQYIARHIVAYRATVRGDHVLAGAALATDPHA